MKKSLLFVVLAVLLTVSSVFAQDMGIQIISGSSAAAETVNLDDLKIGTEAEIDGFGIIKFTDFQFLNSFWRKNDGTISSGKEADYAILWADLTNTTFSAKNYLDGAEVKIFFDDSYEFGGWSYQRDLNWSGAKEDVIRKSDQFAIDPFYQGHYIFGSTLPNFVVSSTAPLKMVITLDGNELTYNIRK